MSHDIFYVQQASYEMLTFLLVSGGASSAIAVVFALYLHSKSWHIRKAARVARGQRKADRGRQRRGQRAAHSPQPTARKFHGPT